MLLHLCGGCMEYADVQLDWGAIRLELKRAREVRPDGKMSVRTLAKKAGIDASTINRIEGIGKYPDHKPDLPTLVAIVTGLGLTLSQFFGRVEGVDLSRHSGDQQSDLSGGSDVPASEPRESDRLSRLESDVATLKTQFGVLQNVASEALKRSIPSRKGRAAAR